ECLQDLTLATSLTKKKDPSAIGGIKTIDPSAIGGLKTIDPSASLGVQETLELFALQKAKSF
ncbi:MAG: hypothetical protein ABGY43_09625, partial [bacterium]